MKRLKFISAICIVLFAVPISATTITPSQLKEARKRVYDWVHDYQYHSAFSDGVYSQQEFTTLFESSNASVVNDYLPHNESHNVTVEEYANAITNDELYSFYVSTKDVKVVRDYIEDNAYYCVIEMTRTISCVLKDDNSYAYPAKTYSAQAYLKYSFDSRDLFCTQIISNDDLSIDYILHEENNNTYINSADTIGLLQSDDILLVRKYVKHSIIDDKFVSVEKDTLTNNIHVGISVGVASFSAQSGDARFNLLDIASGLAVGGTFGYYRQFAFKNRNRWGMDISLRYVQQNTGFLGEYHDSFDAIDPDGGKYLQITDLSNYQETLKRSALELPIAVRYDYFFPQRRDISLYSKIGVCLSYDVVQKTSCQAEAKYSGYYDYLFDVTLEQNGIYNFGQYQLQHAVNGSAIHQVGYGGLVAMGIQWFPIRQLSIEGGFEYSLMYHGVTKPSDYHASLNKDQWTTTTSLFSYYLSHSITFQLTINYNF